MDITIRSAETVDIPALTSLLDELFSIEQDFLADDVKQAKGLELMLASATNAILVAEYQQKVVGMCSLQTLISTAEGGHVGLIEDVVVAKHYRGQGIGKRLLTMLEQWAKQQGLLRIQLLADRSNSKALDFYQAQAWSKSNMLALRKLLPRNKTA